MNLYQEPKQFLLLPKAYEGVMVPSNKKQAVPLKVANPDQPIALADLAELFKYNVWRKIAKHLGLAATGKLQDIVDRVVAVWLERGDLVQFVPGGKGVESIPSDDVDDPSASLVPSGGINDLVVPRKTIVADRLPIVADVLAKSGRDMFQMDPEGATKFILGDEASPFLVAQTTDLLRQGHPGINFLISSPTPRPREAAMILLEGALLHDTAVACAEAVLSVPGIQDFVSTDPSNASLLFLGTDPPPPCLVQAISKVLSSEGFQAILPHSTSLAALYLANSIAGVMVDDDEVARDPDRKPIAAATPASKGTKSVSVASAPKPSKRSPFSPSDQPSFASAPEPSKPSPSFLSDQPASKRELYELAAYRDKVAQEYRQTDQEHQRWMASMLNQHGMKINQHDILLEDHGEKIAQNTSDIYDVRSQAQKNAIAILNMPRMVQKEAEKAARRCIAQDRAKRKAAKEMGLPSPDSSLSPSSSSSSPSSSPLLVSSPVATEGSNRASKQAGSVSGGIVPCSHDASYRNAPGSISPDGRCGLRSILQYLFELLGEERFLVLLFRQRLSLPPDVNFAWGGSRDLRKWLDELWQDCFSKYLRLIISEEIRQDANSSLSLISAEDIKRTQSGGLVYTGECERIREKIYKNTRTIGNPSSDRLMDERIGYVIGSILDVNIYAIQQGQDPQPFYGVATSGITVTLNFDGRHFDIQGHQPHDPPRNSY